MCLTSCYILKAVALADVIECWFAGKWAVSCFGEEMDWKREFIGGSCFVSL